MSHGQNRRQRKAPRSGPLATLAKSIGGMDPPEYDATIGFTKRIRFSVGSANANESVFTQAQLMDLFAMATSATAAYRLASNVRIRKVELWTTPVTATAGQQGRANAVVEFPSDGDFGSKRTRFSDVSISPARPAHVRAHPPPNSLAAQWMGDGSTANILVISCPRESVVELTLDMVLRNGESPTAVSSTVAASVIGTVGIVTLTAAAGTAAQLQALDYQIIA